MKYYIIAGEASGDLHGSNLIKALKVKDQTAEIRCWGGDLMQAAGGTLAKHYKEMAFMGFFEVILNLFTIFENIRFCKKDITEFHPDVVIFIDYSGFNLRIAKWAKKHNYTTNYYISPQIWASREGRIEKIKRDIDAMYVILPFEKEFYAPFLKNPNVSFLSNKTYDLLSIARAALVTSGTATLETAIFKVPQVVCYKANWLSYQIAKRIVTLDYISLVNLIMKKEVVKELIQGDLNTKNLKTELHKILDGSYRGKQLDSYLALEKTLGGQGASSKTAELIVANAS